MKQKRYTDSKERNLVIIERHEKDNPDLPTYKTYYATIKVAGKRNPKLKKVANCFDNLSIATIREKVRTEINDYLENGMSEITLDGFWKTFYKPSLVNKKCKTLDEMERLYNGHIKNEFGFMVMRKIKSDTIYSWFLDTSNQSKATANHCLTIMKAMFNQAITINQVKINPADKISKNHIPSRKRYFSDEERNLFLKELKNIGEESPYGSAFIYLAYLTGARKGELAKATWDDLHGNTIVLSEHKTDDKTDEPRVIYLCEEAMTLINRLPRNTETILNIKSPDRQWKKLIKRTGIKNFRFHDLRHNFGSQSMNMNIGMIRVGKLMGHSSIKAMQIYQTAKPETLQNDIKQIGQYLIN